MITMLIDHLGFAFFSDERYLRVIGRIAFPIYCYLLVVGYQRTRSVKNYSIRLLAIALLSQFPFMYAFNIYNLNVVFTLLFGLLLIIAMDRIPSKWKVVSILLAVVVALIAEELHTDYGAYGIALILIFRYAPGYWAVLFHLILNMVFVFNGWNSSIQSFSLIATMLIVIQQQIESSSTKSLGLPRAPGWLWRAFYPVHLAIIAIIVQGIRLGYF